MKKLKVNKGAVVTNPGSTAKEKTGTWRSLIPIIDKNKCKGCGQCWAFCPDNAIQIKNGKAVIDYDYCKGCGICARECPKKAIKIIEEKK